MRRVWLLLVVALVALAVLSCESAPAENVSLQICVDGYTEAVKTLKLMQAQNDSLRALLSERHSFYLTGITWPK